MPPPPLAVLPLLGDELLLLLQPAAAKAITARAAIAVVRFIIFIFLSLDPDHPAALKHAFWPASGCMLLRQLGDGRLTKSFYGGRIGLEASSRQCPEQGEHRREQPGRRCAACGESRGGTLPTAVVSR